MSNIAFSLSCVKYSVFLISDVVVIVLFVRVSKFYVTNIQ